MPDLFAYLDEHGVAYERQHHPVAYTSQEVAASEHVTGYDVAKTVLLRCGQDIVMVVLPAPMEVDLDRAAEVLGSPVRLAREEEFRDLFPDCEVGAEPPFGNLYGVRVLVDPSLTTRPRIVCRDGTHTGTVTLATEDFLRLVSPEITEIAVGPR